MVNLSRKLYISIFTLILLVVLSGTVTFAWFKLNTNAWFSNVEISASTNANLKISIDGKNYTSTLDAKDLEKSIVAKANGYELRCDAQGEDPYWYDPEEKKNIEITDALLESEFKNMSLKPVTTSDGKRFKSLLLDNITIQSKYYIEFDIYFESIVDGKHTEDVQEVYFSNRTITYDDGTVIPKTEIGTTKAEEIGFPDNILASFKTLDLTTGKMISYDAASKKATSEDGEDITDSFEKTFRTYVSDAVRFSVEAKSNRTTTQDSSLDGGVKIYELNKGNGSYATTLKEKGADTNNTTYAGLSGAMYDANKNAALTYYNTVKKKGLEDGNSSDKPLDPISYNDVPNTLKGLDTIEAAKIIRLDSDNDYGRNGKAMMTVRLWLEGWDADCIDTVLDQDVSITLSFTNYNTFIENDPTELTYLYKNPDTGVIDKSKVRHQVYNNLISDDSPAYFEGISKTFVGWARSNEYGEVSLEYDGNYKDENGNILFDFKNTYVKPRTEGEKWYLVSVFE